MTYASFLRMGRGLVSTVLTVSLTGMVLAPIKAIAATSAPLYSYDFAAYPGSGAVPNTGTMNPTTGLTLFGSWTKTDFGVHFFGNKVNQQSVAYGQPVTGKTLSVAANQALGGTVMFTYSAPGSSACFNDSNNITQIGRFGDNLAQIKLQFSNCGDSRAQVFPECRMAGSLSSSTVKPVMGSQAFVDGQTYLLQCVKSPDPVTGKASLNLRTVRVDSAGNQVTNDTFQISPTGKFDSSAYVSAGNKYPLPAPANNTDQFIGDISKTAYCAGISLADAQACLDAAIPEPASTPPPAQPVLVSNLSDGVTSLKQGDNVTYTVNLANPVASTTATGVDASLTLPAEMTVIDPGSGQLLSANQVEWPIGDLSGGQNATETIAATVSGGNPGANLVAQLNASTTDTTCQNAGSVCGASDTDTIVNPLTQWVLNPSFESDLTGWSTYNSSGKLIRITTDSLDGSASAQVIRTAAGAGIAGLTSKTRWVTSTAAGTVYAASAYVHPGAVGQQFTLQIKEVTSAGTVVGTANVSLAAVSTDWLPITVSRAATGNGNQLIYNLYGTNLAQNGWFNADLLSLTTSN